MTTTIWLWNRINVYSWTYYCYGGVLWLMILYLFLIINNSKHSI